MADPVTMTIIQVGLTAAMYAVTASQTIKGPRLDDTNVTLGDFGTPINRFWGTRWLTLQRIHAEKLKETKKKTKGKGGKYAEYKYSGTWLDLICDHPVDAITKVKLDNRLCFQRTGVGPIGAGSFAAAVFGVPDAPVKLSLGNNFRMYDGTQTAPDPRYAAWCEDEYGPDTAPAFLENSYLSFIDIPLEKFGNRLPQCEAEATRGAAPAYLSEIFPDAYSSGQAYFSPDFRRLLFTSATGGFQVWDVAKRTMIVAGTTNSSRPALNNDGTFYYRDGDVLLAGEGGGTWVALDNPGIECGANLFKAGGAIWADGTIGSTQAALLSLSTNEVITYEIGFRATYYFADIDGDVWASGQLPTADGFGLAKVLPFDGTKHFIDTGSAGDAFPMDNGAGQFFAWQNGQLYLIDKATGDVDLGPIAAPAFVASDDSVIMRGVQPGSAFVWLGLTQVSSTTLATLQSLSATLWTGLSSSVRNPVYDPLNDGIWSSPTIGVTSLRYLNRVTASGVQLKDIVDDVAGWARCVGFDTSLLTMLVPGYSVSQGTGRAMLDPLLKIHDVDARPHDFKIHFLPRTGLPDETVIDTSEFAKDGDSANYEATKQQPVDLPKSVTVIYADLTKDQERNTATGDQVPESGSDQEETVDLQTYADTPDGARQKAERYVRRQWNSRERITNTLTAQQLALEPGDVKILALDDVLMSCRLDRMTVRGMLAIDCEWVRDESPVAVINDATRGAPADGNDDDVIYIPALTRGLIIDAPLVKDADANVSPMLYALAGPYGSPWPGAATFRGDDGDYVDLVATFESTDGATFGYAQTALATANPNYWDRGNTLDVIIFDGTLTSYTEAALNADPSLNLLAVGAPGRWEYVQFANADLTGTNGIARTYTLRGFKRGRRGTEGNVATHLAGDDLVLMTSRKAIVLGASEVGQAMSFKTATYGNDPEFAGAVDLTFRGATLMPLAPCQFRARRDPTTGDWVFRWVRRTRIGGAWTGGSAIPLSENSEAYRVTIGDRTIDVTSPTATWTSAMQTADLGAPQTSLPAGIKVQQISDAVGVGFASAEPLAA